MSALILYPRAMVHLRAVVLGQDIDTFIVPTKLTLTRRPHHQAGTCEVEVSGTALPFDPRAVEDLFIQVYFGCVASMDARVETDQGNLRFVGYADTIEPLRSDKAPVVKITARDLSSLLRDVKPVAAEAVPRYSDTVRDAITRVVVSALSRLGPGAVDSELLEVGEDDDAQAPLGPVVSERARAHTIPVKADASCWEVIEQAAGLATRTVRVELDKIVVRRPRPEGDGLTNPAATLVFGSDRGNLLSVGQAKKFQRNRKGVRVVSYDPSTRARVEAVYPPDAELLTRRRARARGASRAQPPERDVYPVSDGISSPDALRTYAERIYRERSRQELEVTCETPVLTPEVLALKNDDRVAVVLEPDVADILRRDPHVASRLLQQRLGVSAAAAALLIAAAKNPKPDRFYVRTVTFTWDVGGTSSAKIDAVNLIHVEPAS